MRRYALLIATPLLLGAAPPSSVMSLPSYEEPARPWPSVDAAEADRRCRDRIEQVRAQAGKPKLERGPADPGEPLLMYAVDHRIDGCGVLVPVADPADVRTSPEPGPARLIPAG